MTTNKANCPICNEKPTVYYETMNVYCTNCYDGAPDAGPQLIGYSYYTTKLAVEDWNEKVQDYLDEH